MLEPRYDHQIVEEKIYKLWEKSGYFDPDRLPPISAELRRHHADQRGKSRRMSASSPRKSAFSIIMPPPNANGSLHIGHAFEVAIQDLIIRFERMRGKKTLWLPGADHAGFETQVVFDKKLEKEGRSRFGIDRETLFKEIWDFTQANKKIVEDQLRRLGASCDWSRKKFTLDPDIVKIVNETFGKLYRDGLIYRGSRIVNWCSKHQTSLSDVENSFREQIDPFYYLQYGPFVIGTARPETKFGDKYVVMHPNDTRYKEYKDGQKIEVEWINGPITATVVKDKAVDMKFGTGVMTITPWHDPTDFEIAERHGLEKEQIIDSRGKLLPIAGEFAGMKIAEARPLIIEKLKGKGLLSRVDEQYAHSVRTCYKCGTIIEPQIKSQWFVKMAPLAEPAIKAVKAGKIKFYPERSKKVYFHWLKNIRDWDISRQIPWGIRIPAWYCVQSENLPSKKMGFHESVVPQIFKGKITTWRLRDHNLKKGDEVAFENSQIGQIFGYGTITNITRTTIEEIDLQDKAHGATYKNIEELIAAFKRHYPNREIKEDTEVFIYSYGFKKTATETCKPKINPNIKARLFLVRHGETDWNKEERTQGHADIPLNEEGRRQARETAETLKNKNIDLIISSDLGRCRATAEIIREATGAEIILDENLRERHLGVTQGMLRRDRDEMYGDTLYTYEGKPPGGESYKELEERVWESFKQHKKSHHHKNIVIVTHGGSIRMLLKKIKKLDFGQSRQQKGIENAQLTELAVSDPCPTCGGDFYEQDPDVFDTWFSSGQWPFATLMATSDKRPSSAEASAGKQATRKNDFKTFYPTDVMAPGYDILFFWVARMIMLGLYRTRNIPFKTVYLHGLVRDKDRQKMSKSKGNVIDPLGAAETYGTDAIRIALLAGTAAGNDPVISEDKIRGYRNFATKIWNIARFILMNKPERKDVENPPAGGRGERIAKLTSADKKNIAEVKKVKAKVAKHIEKFEFHLAAETAYHYIWHTFADNVIESYKPRLAYSAEVAASATKAGRESFGGQARLPADSQAAYQTLETILLESLKMLHPFMPFITEEIFQKFKPGELLMIEKW